MDVFEAMVVRRSIRKYLDAPVPLDLVYKVVTAGKNAPSCGNLQNWKFVVVTQEEKRKALAEASLQQYWMSSAPIHIVVCVVPQKAIRLYGIRGDRLYSIQNGAAASQNMLLAATSLGLGSCWVSAFDENMVKRAIGMGDQARPQAIITLGYPAESPPEPMHYTIENVTFFENWGTRIKHLDAVIGKFGTRLQKHIGNSIDVFSNEVNSGWNKFKGKFGKK